LKLLEGAEVLVPPEGGRKHPDQKMVKLNTQNILFICGGAFDGLEKIIKQRTEKNSIGFGAEVQGKDDLKIITNIIKDVEPEDLIKFGLIPEFIGRLPVITTLETLEKDSLVKILKEPKNALTKQYKKLFSMEGVTLEFRDDALEAIAQKAIDRKTGARGLRSIMESSLKEIMFELPTINNLLKVVVDKSVINKDEKPYLIYSDIKKQSNKK